MTPSINIISHAPALCQSLPAAGDPEESLTDRGLGEKHEPRVQHHYLQAESHLPVFSHFIRTEPRDGD